MICTLKPIDIIFLLGSLSKSGLLEARAAQWPKKLHNQVRVCLVPIAHSHSPSAQNSLAALVTTLLLRDAKLKPAKGMQFSADDRDAAFQHGFR
jgi:hypothetical protein